MISRRLFFNALQLNRQRVLVIIRQPRIYSHSSAPQQGRSAEEALASGAGFEKPSSMIPRRLSFNSLQFNHQRVLVIIMQPRIFSHGSAPQQGRSAEEALAHIGPVVNRDQSCRPGFTQKIP